MCLCVSRCGQPSKERLAPPESWVTRRSRQRTSRKNSERSTGRTLVHRETMERTHQMYRRDERLGDTRKSYSWIVCHTDFCKAAFSIRFYFGRVVFFVCKISNRNYYQFVQRFHDNLVTFGVSIQRLIRIYYVWFPAPCDPDSSAIALLLINLFFNVFGWNFYQNK